MGVSRNDTYLPFLPLLYNFTTHTGKGPRREPGSFVVFENSALPFILTRGARTGAAFFVEFHRGGHVTFWTARKSPKSRQGVAAIGRPRLPPCHPPPGPLFTGGFPFDLRHNRREEICVASPVPLRACGPGEKKISVCAPLRARLVLMSQRTWCIFCFHFAASSL